MSDIKTGHVYHDGKQGLREVVSINERMGAVRYKVLAAKVEHERDRDSNRVSILGRESTMSLLSFAQWAKTGHTPSDGQLVLLQLRAARLKPSPGETAFLKSIRDEIGTQPEPEVSFEVGFDHTEGRAVAGLEKKGVLLRTSSSTANLLPIGLAWLKIKPLLPHESPHSF